MILHELSGIKYFPFESMYFCMQFCHPQKHLVKSSSMSLLTWAPLSLRPLFPSETKNKSLSSQLSVSEKVTRLLVWGIVKVVKRFYLFFGPEPLHTNCLVCRCIVMEEKPWLITPQFPSADSVVRLGSSDIICTVNLQSLRTSWFIPVILSSVLIVEVCLVLRSFSTSSQLFTKCLCHLTICFLGITSLP